MFYVVSSSDWDGQVVVHTVDLTDVNFNQLDNLIFSFEGDAIQKHDAWAAQCTALRARAKAEQEAERAAFEIKRDAERQADLVFFEAALAKLQTLAKRSR